MRARAWKNGRSRPRHCSSSHSQVGYALAYPLVLAIVAAWLCNLHNSTLTVVATGALIGLIGGLALGMLFGRLWEKFFAALMNRFGNLAPNGNDPTRRD